jgi:hypothetical protein
MFMYHHRSVPLFHVYIVHCRRYYSLASHSSLTIVNNRYNNEYACNTRISMVHDHATHPLKTVNTIHSGLPLYKSIKKQWNTSTHASLSIASPQSCSSHVLSSDCSDLSKTHEQPMNKSSTQTYTFSNPPRELQQQSIQNTKRLRHTRSYRCISSVSD